MEEALRAMPTREAGETGKPRVEEAVDDGLGGLDALGGELFGVGEGENGAGETRRRDVHLLGRGGEPVREERGVQDRCVLEVTKNRD